MPDYLIFIFSFLFPLVGMVLIPLLPYQLRSKASFAFVLLISVITSIPAFRNLTGNSETVVFRGAVAFGNITLRIDPLSAWFILIINLTCINGAFYGMGYMRQYEAQRSNLTLHWILYLLFQSSMLWVCMVQNGLAFLIVWELMSISSFLLIMFDHQSKATLRAGINYIVQMHTGVLFLTAAFIWVYFSEGSFEFSAIEKFFAVNYNLWLFLLFFVGFGIKAGFIPLHSWLPLAHPAAPSHISGVMSGVIVKLGIYGILRMVFLLKADYTLIGQIIIILSLLTGLYGILNAAVHRDFKKMLAYCTIENIGIIGIGIGIGLMGMGNDNFILALLGFTAALLHVLNHSLFKSLLFFTAGSVYQQTHTRDMEKLGGLVKHMPKTAIFFLLGGMAIGGLPPFNGFVSEFLIYSGLLLGIKTIGISHITLLIFSLAGLALIGGLSMITFTKSFGTIFLGRPRTHFNKMPKEVSFEMQAPQYFILMIMLSIGLFPQLYFSIVNSIVLKYIPAASSANKVDSASLLNNISAIGKFALLFIILLVTVYIIRNYFTRQHTAVKNPTWSCGYSSPTVKMQYTGKSFSKSLGKLLDFIVLEKKKYKEISGTEIFPAARNYSSHYNDFFVTNLFNKIIDRLLYSLNYFQFIQNGKIYMYITYGIFFIVFVFLATVFKLI